MNITSSRGLRQRCRSNRSVVAPVAWIVSGLLLAAAVPAAPPTRSRSQSPRFLDKLLSREEPTPAFIAVPQPPSAEDVESLARKAARTQPAATPPRPAPAAPPARLPTWDETVSFSAAVQATVSRAAADAVDPDYRPRRPAVASQRPAGRRPGDGPVAASAASLVPSGAAPPRNRRFERLRGRIAQTIAVYQRRPLNTAQHTPWEVMHGFIAFGIPTQVRVGGPAGDLVNAIGWSNTGGRCRGQVMLAAADDRLVALKGVGVQGHSAQYLAILAQCRVAVNSPIQLQSKSFTVADLIEEEQLACKAGTELTFALIALSHYLPTDAEWRSRDGQEWSLERLVEEEIVQPIRGAPCGGTHRLFGLSYACQRRLRATGGLDGAYLRADKYVRDYQQFTLAKLQNRDGSFSTEWFKYPADRDDDIDRKIQTTGHMLEWLVGSLDQEKLYDPRVVAATEFLATALASEPSRDWKIGPLGHALHALTIYQERVWGVVLPGGIAAYHGPMKAAPVAMANLESRTGGTSATDAGDGAVKRR